MKINIKSFFILTILASSIISGQIKKIGLDFNKVTSITTAENSYYGKIIIAGTEVGGLYFHNASDADTAWTRLFFNNTGISSVYAQELDSINTKMFLAVNQNASTLLPLIYTNVFPVQSALVAEDSGLDRSKIKIIKSIAGFNSLPDGTQMPVFCCSNDPSIYKYQNNVWNKVWEGTFFVNINFVYAKDSTVWAGGLYNGIIASPLLLKSENFGITWDTLKLPIGEVFSCYSLCTAPGNPDLVFVGMNEHILKSTDGGKTWTDCLPDVYNVIFTTITINPNNPEQIFAGGRTYNDDMVLFKSEDNGGTWKQLLTDCNCIFKGINTMAGLYVDNRYFLFLCTDGEGIYKYSNNITNVKNGSEKPEKFILFQNYPNPFNPETKIKYNLPERGWVRIFITDILGREINSLINEYQNAGLHEINFNAKNLTSGIYIYKITAGKYSAVKKMVLLR